MLFKFNGAPPDAKTWVNEQNGWYRGKVTKVATQKQRTETPGVTHEVTFRNDETGDVIPKCFGWLFRGRRAAATMCCGLSEASWGKEKKWVLLRDSDA